jgi:hypothetical protein
VPGVGEGDGAARELPAEVYDDAAAIIDSVLRGDPDGVVGTFDAAVSRNGLQSAYDVAWCLAATMVAEMRPAGFVTLDYPSNRTGPLRRAMGGSVCQCLRECRHADRGSTLRCRDGGRTAVRVSDDVGWLRRSRLSGTGSSATCPFCRSSLIQVFAWLTHVGEGTQALAKARIPAARRPRRPLSTTRPLSSSPSTASIARSSPPAHPSRSGGRRTISIYPPYALDKASLLGGRGPCTALSQRADQAAHRSRQHLRMHLFGCQSDLERTELLYTSLLVQASYGLAGRRRAIV